MVNKAIEIMNRDVAQLVSAPALGAGGPPFESEYPDRLKIKHLQEIVGAFFLYVKFVFANHLQTKFQTLPLYR